MKKWFKFQWDHSGFDLLTPLFLISVGFERLYWVAEIKRDYLLVGLLPNIKTVQEGEEFKFKWIHEWIFKKYYRKHRKLYFERGFLV